MAIGRRRAWVLAAAGLLGALPAGCNIAGPVFFLVHGPEKVKKVYELDAKKTTVVFIDDRQNRVPRRTLRLAMGEECEKALLKEKVVADMVTAESALTAAGTDRYGKPLPIAQVGAAVKAETVIYVTVDDFSLTQDNQSLSPVVNMRVKVIDVASDARLWPEEERGHPLSVRPKASARDLPANLSARYKLEDDLARQAGREVAQLFYNHEPHRGPRTPD
jgi:hypothetical protein